MSRLLMKIKFVTPKGFDEEIYDFREPTDIQDMERRCRLGHIPLEVERIRKERFNMVDIDKEIDTENKDSNVVPLKVITGGKGGGDDWLLKMNIKSMFSTRKKDFNDVELLTFWVVSVNHPTVVLVNNLNDQNTYYTAVDGHRFSKDYELVELLNPGESSIIKV